jgi:hypothetical protein
MKTIRRHCEEQHDAAIQFVSVDGFPGLLRFARNDQNERLY